MFKSRKCPNFYQYLSTYCGLLGLIASGMQYAWPSPSLPQLTANGTRFEVSSEEGSWIAIMPLIGAVFGCIVAGWAVDVLGRKRLLLITTVPFLLHWLMIAFCRSVQLLLVARFIVGVADGALFTTIPIYIGEIADPQIRGRLGSSISVTWNCGMLLINVLGLSFDITTTALMAATVPILCWTFAWMPESPYFLLMQGRANAAERALAVLKGTADVAEELNRLKTAVKAQSLNKNTLADLFTIRSYRAAFLLITLMRTAQQLSGVAAITFYTKVIFEQAGDFVSPKSATITYAFLQMLMAVFCSSIVDKIGRRPLLITSIMGAGTALFILGTYFYLESIQIHCDNWKFLPFTALISFVIVYNVGLQPIPILMLGELFPTNIKGFASGMSEIYFCIMASAASKFFQIIKDSYGMYLAFYFFSICCFINLFLIVIFIPETKGKTLEQIQADL